MTARAESRPAVLSRNHWILLALSLSCILLVSAWGLLHPSVYAWHCEQHYLPSVEGRFGFHGGRALLPGRDRESYVLLEVERDGPLGRAGVQPGDVPVFSHGGLADFCGALQASEAGYSPEVDVVSGPTFDYSTRRTVRVPAVKPHGHE